MSECGRNITEVRKKHLLPMSSDNTDSILKLIATGDDSAFNLLIEKYGNLVWAIGRKFLYKESDVEDAVQEVFIAIWKAAEKFDHTKASEVTFISMIARRRFIDYLRKVSKHKNLQSIDEDNGQELFKESILNESTDLQLIKDAIGSLEIEDQELLNLSIYKGYSHSEIAKLLNIPLGTVKTRIRRNLIKLKGLFDIEQQATVIELKNG